MTDPAAIAPGAEPRKLPPSDATITMFLAAYREALRRHYTWAANPDALDRYMIEVARTIRDRGNTVDLRGTVATEAWQAIGRTGACTRAKLRRLPE